MMMTIEQSQIQGYNLHNDYYRQPNHKVKGFNSQFSLAYNVATTITSTDTAATNLYSEINNRPFL